MIELPREKNHSMRVFSVLWGAFFLQGMALGAWFPALTNILVAKGLSAWVPAAFMVPPFCALISPVIGGALADQKFSANRLHVVSSFLTSIFLVAAFFALDCDWHPLWFLGFLAIGALVSGPTWGYLATISLTHLTHGDRQYPLVRVGATVGWIAGGVLTSYVLHADASPIAGYAGASVRLVAAGLALMLPFTPPLGVGNSWKKRLGFDAYALMKQRDHLVFFVVTVLFSIPISAFYMYGPEFLKVLGDDRPTGTMAVAQVLEIVSMMFLGMLLARHRVKVVLLWALGLSVVRFAMSAQAGVSGIMAWHIGGIALHGVSYTLYFVTAQIFIDRRVDRSIKGQAQGLLQMMAYGLGPLIGSFFCGWLRQVVVMDDGEGWTTFWSILAAMIAVSTLIFAVFYRGIRKPAEAV